MNKIWTILTLLMVTIGPTACSKSSQDDDTQTSDTADTATSTDTHTDTHADSATTSDTTDSNSTDGSTDTTGTDGDTDADTDGDSDSDTDTDADSDSDTDSDTALDTGTDTSSDPNGDSESETVVEADSSTAPVITACDSPDATAGCYHDDIWCFENNTPTAFVQYCEGGQKCAQLTSGGAQCQCEPNQIQRCDEGNVWNFDSCGNRGSLVVNCETREHCVNRSDGTAECSKCLSYWGGENCDVCMGYNQGDKEHCQCPNEEYIPIRGTEVCLTEELSCIGENCDERYPFEMTIADAKERCPEGFRLPTVFEIQAYLFNGLKSHGDCSDYPCGDWYSFSSFFLWTSEPCVSYQVQGIAASTVSCSDNGNIIRSVICISE